MNLSNAKIAVIGLGYVGLPLATAFGKIYPVVGFDVNQRRINELDSGWDSTSEISEAELKSAEHLFLSSNPEDLKLCNVFVVTVPTPIDQFNAPDMRHLVSASELVGRFITDGAYVVFESTVYPGATEEVCIPIIEQISKKKLNDDFFCGYSPERINPGDKIHRLPDIIKVVSGSTEKAADFLEALYASVIPAGTYRATSIKVAEAAKVIENTQRDLNIALINELSIIFDKLEINTADVLDAAGTKWNFLPFRPGLVGGHCIGVDPYYLTYRSQVAGYHPELILAGRRINDSMASYVVNKTVRALVQNNISSAPYRVLILGIAFKEDCPDVRNSKAADLVEEFRSLHFEVDIWDPVVSQAEAERVLKLSLIERPEAQRYDAIIIAVAHEVFAGMGAASIRALGKPKHILFDLKSIFLANESDVSL